MSMDIISARKGPELLDDLESRLGVLLQQQGLAKKSASSMALKITREMAVAWGGQNIYFPVGKTRWAQERDWQIFEEFRGDNHAELARKYQLTVPHIYRLIKRCKEKQRDSVASPGEVAAKR